MIYDAFLFFDELDLLEIRLTELYPVVDRFVIVEADHTFTGISKSYNYQQNEARYSQWADKIVYLPITLPSSTNSAWGLEQVSRNYLEQWLQDNTEEPDYVILSDADEIVRREMVSVVQQAVKLGTVVGIEQPYYWYWLNWKVTGFPKAYMGRMVRGFKKWNRSSMNWRAAASVLVNNGGWHFSFLGNAAQISAKLSAWSHQEYNTPQINNLTFITSCVNSGADLFGRPGYSASRVAVDNTFPHAVVENQAKWASLIN